MATIYLTPFDHENMEHGERYADHALTDYDLEEMYRDDLDEIHGEVLIAGTPYSTSRTLEQVDPIAYRCGFNDWLDGMVQDDQIIEVEA